MFAHRSFGRGQGYPSFAGGDYVAFWFVRVLAVKVLHGRRIERDVALWLVAKWIFVIFLRCIWRALLHVSTL